MVVTLHTILVDTSQTPYFFTVDTLLEIAEPPMSPQSWRGKIWNG